MFVGSGPVGYRCELHFIGYHGDAYWQITYHSRSKLSGSKDKHGSWYGIAPAKEHLHKISIKEQSLVIDRVFYAVHRHMDMVDRVVKMIRHWWSVPLVRMQVVFEDFSSFLRWWSSLYSGESTRSFAFRLECWKELAWRCVTSICQHLDRKAGDFWTL